MVLMDVLLLNTALSVCIHVSLFACFAARFAWTACIVGFYLTDAVFLWALHCRGVGYKSDFMTIAPTNFLA